MKNLLTFVFFILHYSVFNIQYSFAQVKVVKFDAIKSLLDNKSDSTIVINFWATWCKPCITELPYFEELQKNTSSEKVKIILISLDFKRQLDSRVNPFVAENKMTSEVLLLDEPDYNSWIDKVDSSWTGAIPATLVIDVKKQKHFYEKEFTSYLELRNIIKQ